MESIQKIKEAYRAGYDRTEAKHQLKMTRNWAGDFKDNERLELEDRIRGIDTRYLKGEGVNELAALRTLSYKNFSGIPIEYLAFLIGREKANLQFLHSFVKTSKEMSEEYVSDRRRATDQLFGFE